MGEHESNYYLCLYSTHLWGLSAHICMAYFTAFSKAELSIFTTAVIITILIFNITTVPHINSMGLSASMKSRRTPSSTNPRILSAYCSTIPCNVAGEADWVDRILPASLFSYGSTTWCHYMCLLSVRYGFVLRHPATQPSTFVVHWAYFCLRARHFTWLERSNYCEL